MIVKLNYVVMKFNKDRELTSIESDSLISIFKDYTLADYVLDHIDYNVVDEIDVKEDNDVTISLRDGNFVEYVVTDIEDIEE